MPSTSPRLWVVATPLGNPGDLSPRARDVLTEAALVLAEDTRRAGQLFARCGLSAQRFMSFHDHNEEERLPRILDELRGGAHIALISDAGMPLMADPGFRLVRACRAEGIDVSVLPGPSAPITALAGSGIAPQPFTFLGFPPRKRSDVEKLFAEYATVRTTLVFFERKDRLADTLDAAHAALGPRECCIARELTKPHEEFILLRLEDRAQLTRELLGEITVVIGPPESVTATPSAEVLALLADEAKAAPDEKPRELARRVHEATRGWTVKDIYKLLQDNR
ncbi:16S rRNA (cytidine(1402)-2'-O)-methyltransferase [Nitratidesulfovibrio sp.]|uniref:16S rRNA (cytidine(1402)-2'-O)-methyltransferase n=1 Tax=Nitratidesulfovibrio sp. TaxID=2802297 RepID=UPI003342ADE6